ncbi:MAG: hypothetical protein IID40_10495 [Planctomycetes bacterium]|nr:hypothetical protein [Planctomycetota bacterium]
MKITTHTEGFPAMDLDHPTTESTPESSHAVPRQGSASPGEGEFRTLSAEAIRLLQTYPAPRNQARLHDLLRRLQSMCRPEDVDRPDGQPPDAPAVAPGTAPASSNTNGALPPLSRVAREHIIRVYRATGCNKTRTARILEIDIKTVYNKLKRYGVD